MILLESLTIPLTYDFFGVKTVRNNDEHSEYRPTVPICHLQES